MSANTSQVGQSSDVQQLIDSVKQQALDKLKVLEGYETIRREYARLSKVYRLLTGDDLKEAAPRSNGTNGDKSYAKPEGRHPDTPTISGIDVLRALQKVKIGTSKEVSLATERDSTVIRHRIGSSLHILKYKGLVKAVKKDRRTYFSLTPAGLKRIAEG